MSTDAPMIDPPSVPSLLRGDVAVITCWVERWTLGRSGRQVMLIMAGAGIFGAAMGSWRDPLQTVILLIGFAPVAWIFSQSTTSVVGMGILHLLFWIVAVLFGARFLGRSFNRLGIRSEAGINVWLLIFVLVMLQMTTALRPMLGRADHFLPTDKKFFLSHWAATMGAGDDTQRR